MTITTLTETGMNATIVDSAGADEISAELA